MTTWLLTRIVLAYGAIIKVDKETHADLFRALKSGGKNLGIVTNFKMVTTTYAKV